MADDEVKTGTLRRMLDIDDVLQFVPLSRSTILRMEKKGKFPRSKFITPNRRVWFEDEILAWQEAVGTEPSRRRILRRSPMATQPN
jgi:prophage regulatory protein